MIELLDKSWCMRSEIVPCLVGPPGIGKTAAVMQHAKAHGCDHVVKIVASRCVPSETVGMTMPDHKHRSMEIYNSMQLSSLRDGDILFLDELLEADQFVLSTLLTVIESREMADGTPLPDIQIIAATNDTIPPEQLKGNIRQRFMFMRFNADKEQTRQYILEKTDMYMPDTVLDKLCETGNDYNFLTPRSLTKLCLWMDSVDDEDMLPLSGVINSMWGSTLGNEIYRARRARDTRASTPEAQVRRVIKNLEPQLSDENKFDDCSLAEILEILQAQPNWEDISKTLAGLEIEEMEEEEEDIKF
jgi:hypothetical protein